MRTIRVSVVWTIYFWLLLANLYRKILGVLKYTGRLIDRILYWSLFEVLPGKFDWYLNAAWMFAWVYGWRDYSSTWSSYQNYYCCYANPISQNGIFLWLVCLPYFTFNSVCARASSARSTWTRWLSWMVMWTLGQHCALALRGWIKNAWGQHFVF